MEVAVTKDGTAFVTNQDDGTVAVIPAGANAVARTIQVSSTPGKTENPHGIAAGPDGTIYVTNISSNHVAAINRALRPWPTASMSRADPRRPPSGRTEPST